MPGNLLVKTGLVKYIMGDLEGIKPFFIILGLVPSKHELFVSSQMVRVCFTLVRP